MTNFCKPYSNSDTRDQWCTIVEFSFKVMTRSPQLQVLVVKIFQIISIYDSFIRFSIMPIKMGMCGLSTISGNIILTEKGLHC